MKTAFRSLQAILILLAVVSCKPCKEIVTTVHDTVSHTETITRHDTTLTMVPDSAGWRAFFTCQKNSQGVYVPVINNQSTITGNHIHVSAGSSANGQGLNVNVDCKTDSLKTVITLLEKTIKDYRDKETVKSVPVNYLTGWQWFQVWCGRILLGIIGIGLIFVIIKFGIKRFI